MADFLARATPDVGAIEIGAGLTLSATNVLSAPTGGSGTVTSVSVATANGFSGTVANATTTPEITISVGQLNQDTTGKSAKTDALNSATTVVNVSSATAPSNGQVLTATGATAATWQTPTTGTVTAVSVATANGFSGSSSGGATPALTIVAGAITPTSVNGVTISGSSTPTLAVTGTTAVSGSNTGDQTFSDATISTSDITTNDFSTSKHGFVPKGTNVGNFLKDDGTWHSTSGTGAVSFYAGSFTYDLSTASGDLAVTGVGFKPASIMIKSAAQTAAGNRRTQTSDGWARDGGNSGCSYASRVAADVGGGTTDLVGVSTTQIIVLGDTVSTTGQTAIVKTYDADGFTLTFTKNGSPSATTATFIYFCFA